MMVLADFDAPALSIGAVAGEVDVTGAGGGCYDRNENNGSVP